MKNIEDQTTMKDILVVAKIKEVKFEKFMCFMQSEEGVNERKKIADLTKTLGTVSADRRAVMFKIAVHNEDALNSFLDGSNPVSKPIFDEVMESYEIFELNKASHTMPKIRLNYSFLDQSLDNSISIIGRFFYPIRPTMVAIYTKISLLEKLDS